MQWQDAFGPLAGLFGGGVDAAVSAKMAADNRKFQERMTRNRYTYQMEDMKNAGLNPILASGQAPPGAPPGAMGKGTAFGTTLPATAKVASEIDNIDQQTATSAQQQATIEKQGKLVDQQAHTQRTERERMRWTMALLEQQALGQGLTNITGKTEAEIMEGPLGKILQGLKIGGVGAGAVMGGTGNLLQQILGLIRGRGAKGPNSAKGAGDIIKLNRQGERILP